MSVRKPLMEKSINSNFNQALNFSFDKSTEKKGSKTQNTQIDELKKRPLKQKQVLDLFLGELKEHNHQKMIQMFGQLRKQNKEKDQNIQLLTKEVSDLGEEFKQVKLEYGRCLKEKTRLQQELACQTRQVNIFQTKFESQQRQMKELQLKQEESLYYKSQLFEANEKINEYKRNFVDPDETVENEREFKFKQMQWTYEMKLDECEQHIKELEKENWELGQVKIRHQTTIKRLNIDLHETNIQIKKLSSFPHHYTHSKALHPSIATHQELQTLKQQIQALQKQVEFTTETYELKIVQLESELELEKFKTQTYQEHSQTLQDKLNCFQIDLNTLKQDSFSLQQHLETQQTKTFHFDTLLRQVLAKLKDFAPNNILIADYAIILNNKLQRISRGKPVTFLKNDTKDFVSISSHSKDSQAYGAHSLTSKLNRELKLVKTQQKVNSFHSESEPSCQQTFRSNYTSIKKNDQIEPYSRNSQLSDMHVSRLNQNEKFDSKILEERKQIQKRIRQKYMKSRPKDLNEKSMLKEQSILQIKESSMSQVQERSPHFKHEDRQSIYLTSEFQQ